MGYLRPCDAPISSDWADHKYRNPPSSEPGTDYACGQFTPLVAPDNGYVVDYKTSTGGATGRYITIDLDDGRRVRMLHLREVRVTGGRVSRGQVVALSGGSAYGNEYGVGAHVHVTLWSTHRYEFNSNATMDFDAQVSGGGGNADLNAGQRKAKTVVNRRSEPNTGSANLGDPLQPGTVGNFVGWVHGENVEGNDVWYKGTSGNWFWSGGFEEGANGTGIEDLNPKTPAPIGSSQRRVGGNGVNGRGSASPNGEFKQTLTPGTVGDFKGFVRGESVEGNDIWFVGSYSGDYFWSGGFEGGANTSGLADLTPAAPVTPSPGVGSSQRKVGPNSVNGRSQATTAVPVVQSLDAGTVGDFKGYVTGESVEGNNVWFVGAYSGNFFWSGGFEGGANTAGLSNLGSGSTPAPQPETPTPGTHNPQVVELTAADFPAWIKFDEQIWKFPAKLNSSFNEGYYSYLKSKYPDTTPYTPSNSAHDHWWGKPTAGYTHDGTVREMTQSDEKSVNFVVSAGRVTRTLPLAYVALTTGKANMTGWKTENDPKLTDLGYRTLAYVHYMVEKKNPSFRSQKIWLHKELLPGQTECSEINVAKVRAYVEDFFAGRLDPNTGVAPVGGTPTPEVPTPETPKPEQPSDTVNVPKSWLQSLLDSVKKLLGQ